MVMFMVGRLLSLDSVLLTLSVNEAPRKFYREHVGTSEASSYVTAMLPPIHTQGQQARKECRCRCSRTTPGSQSPSTFPDVGCSNIPDAYAALALRADEHQHMLCALSISCTGATDGRRRNRTNKFELSSVSRSISSRRLAPMSSEVLKADRCIDRPDNQRNDLVSCFAQAQAQAQASLIFVSSSATWHWAPRAHSNTVGN